MKTLKADPAIPKSFRPVAFWFLNHHMEDEELIRQIREMDEQGFGGFMLHGRDGLRDEYLSPAWERIVSLCIAEAEKLGLEVWLYDENHYPSGPAGGLLNCRFPDDRTMSSLVLAGEYTVPPNGKVNITLPLDSFSAPIGWGQRINPGDVVRLREDDVPMLLAVSQKSGKTVELGKFVINGKLCMDSPFASEPCVIMVLYVIPFSQVNTAVGHYQYQYYPDGYDRDLTDDFIKITHAWYNQRFGQHFGHTVKGIFTDNYSPNFGFLRRSIPWGRDFETRFKDVTNIPLKKLIPGLFNRNLPDSRRARLIYWRFAGQEYLRSYYDRITAYCSSVGLLSTGHLCLEDGMAEHIRQIGDYFEVMRAFTFNAVDQLGPKTKNGSLAGSIHDGEHLTGCIRNTASAALWNGGDKVMCEAFGCAAYNWKLDLGEIKRISGWLFGLGVNLFVPHGLYYSIAGHRKWECTPDHLHSPQWHYYHSWTDWISRLAQYEVGGLPLSVVAVFYPVHSLRAGLDIGLPSGADLQDKACFGHGAESNRVQQTFRWTQATLLHHHIDFEVIDEETFARGKSTPAGIEIETARGTLRFKALIMPEMSVIESGSAELLRKHAENHGLVIGVNRLPSEFFQPDAGTLEPTPWNSAAKFRCIETEISDSSVTRENPLISVLDEITCRNIRIHETSGRGAEIITRSWSRNGERYHYIFNASLSEVELCLSTDTVPGGMLSLSELDDDTWFIIPDEIKKNFTPGSGVIIRASQSRLSSTMFPAWKAVSRSRVDGKWDIIPLNSNYLPLKTWQTSYNGRECTWEVKFRSRVALSKCRLLLDMEQSVAELESHHYFANATCFMNGNKLDGIATGQQLDRHIYEVELNNLIRAGENTLKITRSSFLLDRERPLHPPILAGDFKVEFGESNEPVISPPEIMAAPGAWNRNGYPFYSGEFSYRILTEIPNLDRDERLELDCGALSNSAAIYADGEYLGCCISCPWRFDLSHLAGKSVLLEIRVANIPDNLFENTGSDSGLFGPIEFLKMQK